MTDRANLLKLIDEMIQLGETLLPFKKENSATQIEWETKCQRLLERAFGTDNLYLRDFELSTNYANPEAQIEECLKILKAAREELAGEVGTDRLEKIEKEIVEAKAEGERRKAVANEKFWGSVIELIQMQREELKNRSKLNQEITKIHREIEEMKSLLTKLNSRLDEMQKMED